MPTFSANTGRIPNLQPARRIEMAVKDISVWAVNVARHIIGSCDRS